MSEEHIQEDLITCPVCSAGWVDAAGTVCPNCGAEIEHPVEDVDSSETGEQSIPEGFPEGTASPSATATAQLTDGFDLQRDPTTLNQEELIMTVNSIRKMVIDLKPIADATIAYAIKCIAIMRQSRPAAGKTGAREKIVTRAMQLDDF